MFTSPDYRFQRAGYSLTGRKSFFLFHKGQDLITSGHSLTLTSLQERTGEITPTTRFVEIGAGLDALVYDIHTQINPSLPPIIIDPINYRIIIDLLEDALIQYQDGKLDIFPEVAHNLEKLQQRAHLYTQKDKVLHLRVTLEAALVKYPWLLGYTDIVVDNYTAHYYSFNKSTILK